jgi:hypothetical protein
MKAVASRCSFLGLVTATILLNVVPAALNAGTLPVQLPVVEVFDSMKRDGWSST